MPQVRWEQVFMAQKHWDGFLFPILSSDSKANSGSKPWRSYLSQINETLPVNLGTLANQPTHPAPHTAL